VTVASGGTGWSTGCRAHNRTARQYGILVLSRWRQDRTPELMSGLSRQWTSATASPDPDNQAINEKHELTYPASLLLTEGGASLFKKIILPIPQYFFL